MQRQSEQVQRLGSRQRAARSTARSAWQLRLSSRAICEISQRISYVAAWPRKAQEYVLMTHLSALTRVITGPVQRRIRRTARGQLHLRPAQQQQQTVLPLGGHRTSTFVAALASISAGIRPCTRTQPANVSAWPDRRNPPHARTPDQGALFSSILKTLPAPQGRFSSFLHPHTPRYPPWLQRTTASSASQTVSSPPRTEVS